MNRLCTSLINGSNGVFTFHNHMFSSTQIKMQKQKRCPFSRQHMQVLRFFSDQTFPLPPYAFVLSPNLPQVSHISMYTPTSPTTHHKTLTFVQYTHMYENVNNNKLIADYTHLLHILRMPADCLFTGFNGM